MAERSNAKVRLVRVLASDSFFGTTQEADWTSASAELGRSERTTALSDLYALAAECRSGFKPDVIVDLHGGRVAVESAGPGKGATFKMILPVT